MKGVIQIGAHYAQEYEDFKKQGALHYIFFEPLKEPYKVMCERLPKDANILTFNIALGNEKKFVVMNTEQVNFGMSSSILKPTGHLKQFPHITFDSKAIVEMDKLDNIKYDRSLYDFICLDVQGYELEVLKGAAKSLEHIKEILIDVHAGLYENGATIEEIDSLLVSLGFVGGSYDWYGREWGTITYKKLENVSN
jgi:FkbM family methyltransferase